MLKIGFLGLCLVCSVSAVAEVNGSETPAIRAPLCASNNDPYIEADFLYWVAKQEGNTFAATGTAITVPGTVDPNTGLTPPSLSGQGSVLAPNPVGKPGFKVSAGVNLEYDHWDIFAEYTWFYSHETNTALSSDDFNLNAGILPIFSYTPNNSILSQATYAVSSGATGFVTGTNASWSLQFNNLNLELGRAIPISCFFVLHPHFGLQGSWQKQCFHAHYSVTSYSDFSTPLGGNDIYFDQKFWGVGPRVGMDALWQCCKHLGVFGDAAFSALWGNFRAVSSSYDTNIASSYSDVLIANQSYNPSTLSPVMQLMMGVQTDWKFRDRYRFSGHVAWETQVWFFQNQHSSSIADTNLVLQGLTLGGRVDF